LPWLKGILLALDPIIRKTQRPRNKPAAFFLNATEEEIRPEMDKRLNIDRVAFIGRTFDEYVRIFGLDDRSLREGGPVLDCPSGAASFAAEAHLSGLSVTACDILYDQPVTELIRKGEEDIRLIHDRLSEVSHRYVWDYYRDMDDLITYRKKALGLFAEDFANGSAQGRYVKASLPYLPFADNSFSLVISSHFLFLYGGMLNPDFHKAALTELMRVSSGEVRIFPVCGLDARPYRHLDDVISFLHAALDVEVTTVPFEFQRGGNKLMTIRRKKSPPIGRT
jgi:hypothetical protein